MVLTTTSNCAIISNMILDKTTREFYQLLQTDAGKDKIEKALEGFLDKKDSKKALKLIVKAFKMLAD